MLRRISPPLLAVALSLFVCASAAAAELNPFPARGEPNESRWNRWYIVADDQFQVCSQESHAHARAMLGQCHDQLGRLCTTWSVLPEQVAWQAPCQVLLHPSLKSYLATVGPGGEHTNGSSLVNVEHGKIISRQIDLRLDLPEAVDSALAHELTHVIMSGVLPREALPQWADEGMAVLADDARKRHEHELDLRQSLRSGTAFALVALVHQHGYPSSGRWTAFYAQSVSLVEFLVDRQGPAKFVEFLELASQQGYDHALTQYYDIADLGELDRQWRSHLETSIALQSPDDAHVAVR